MYAVGQPTKLLELQMYILPTETSTKHILPKLRTHTITLRFVKLGLIVDIVKLNICEINSVLLRAGSVEG